MTDFFVAKVLPKRNAVGVSIQSRCHESYGTTKLPPKFDELAELARGKIVGSPDTPRVSFFRKLDPASVAAHSGLKVGLYAVRALRRIAGASAVAIGKAAAL